MFRLQRIVWQSLVMLIGGLGWVLSAQAAGVSDATQWLNQQQQTKGSWGGAQSSAGAVETTSAVLEALASVGQGGSANATKAWTYLQGAKPTTTAGLARRIIAAIAVKRAPLALDKSKLLALQLKSGGFAPSANHQATTLDTALALIALGVSSNQSLAAARAGVSYLITKQRRNGSWGFFDNTNDPSAYLTGLSMLALSHYRQLYNLTTPLTHAIKFLKGKQATDGSWGVGRDRVLDTSLSVLGLTSTSQTVTALVSKAVSFLAKGQASDGSFASKDPFATAYALRALDSERADLYAIAKEVIATPKFVVLGTKLQLKVKIHNEGTKDAKAVVIRLYRGDPKASGQKLDEKTVASLATGGSNDITLEWKDAKPQGPHYLYIVIDPDQKINETNERNNTVVWGIRVLPPIDLAITTRDITLKPVFPAPGKTLEVTATVHNKGGVDAKQVEVDFYNGDPSSGGKKMGSTQTIASIEAGKFSIARINTPPLPQGKMTVYVVVDPNKKTKDAVTSNNKAKKEFSVQPRVDLLISPQGIFFSKQTVTEGQDVEIRVGVYNAEATTATDAIVRLYDGAPSSGGKQIGTDVKITVPGYKAVYTTPFLYKTFGKAGSHIIYAVVDPDNKLPDIQTTNNVALRTLKVVGLPDLSVTTSAITFSPTIPLESSTMYVYATITNKGETTSKSGTKVLFYDTDPSKPGAKPVYTTSISALTKGRTTRPRMTYYPYKKLGPLTFWVVLDPDKVSPDRDRTNNAASRSTTVRDSTYPDLFIAASDITFNPTTPQAGTNLTIQARVRNRYRRLSTNILVRFHSGSPTTSNKIGETTITQIPGYGSALTSFTWSVPPTLSSATIYVVIDPLNKIRETTTSNNKASRYIDFALGQSTAPTNLTITNVGATDLKFQWKAGAGAVAAGVQGYRLYCNSGLLNPPTKITGVTAKASSERTTSYTAAKTVDNKTNTYWEPKTLTTPWLEYTLPKVEEVSAINLYLYSTYTRSFELQAWLNNKWSTLQKRTSTRTEFHQFVLDKPVTTNKFRVLFSTVSRYYYVRTREIAFFRSNLAKGTTYTHTKFYHGRYSCYAVAVTTPLLMSPRSKEATAKVGDTTAPGIPSGVAAYYNPSLYENRMTWNGVTDSDLAGYLVYNDTNLDVAHYGRGASIYGPSISRYAYYYIDGNTTSTTYISSSNHITVKLAKSYSIHEIRVYLRTTADYSYRLEYSTDGKSFTTLATKNNVRGLQVHPLSSALGMRYIRIKPVSSGNFYMAELQALTKDLALASTHTVYQWRRYFSRRTGASHWYSYWNGYTSDYRTRVLTARQFIIRNVNMTPLNVLTITDLDTGQILARISGQHQIWRSSWLRAKNYRIHATGLRDGFEFNVETILTRRSLTTPTYGHSPIYRNGSYQYGVSSVDVIGNESAVSPTGTSIVKDTTAPTVPYRFRATAGNSQVSLSWYASSSSRDRKGYIIYRDGKKLIETTARSYIDKSVVNGTTYSYEVSSIDYNSNESGKAGPLKATPTAIDLSFNIQGSFADLFISPKNPSVYESMLIIAMVRNIGTQSAPSGIEVDLYDGSPKTGTKIGTITLNKPIRAGLGIVGSFNWKLAKVRPGKRTIYAVIDPNNKISELNEKNNTATVEVSVHADPFLATYVNKIDSSKFPVVDVFMSVKDANGGGLFGLDDRNFKVWEDAVREIPITVKQLTQPTKKIPKADLAFVIDTSCSMLDEWKTVCEVVDDIRDLLLASRIDTKVTIYGLGTQMKCGVKLSTVIWRGKTKGAHVEDWGPGSTWASFTHKWRADAIRIIIPISDEGAYAGNGWTKEDTEAVDEMIKAAKKAGAIYYPFWGKEIRETQIVAVQMKRAAKDTGGEAFPFKNATQVVQAIVRGVRRSISDYKITYTTHNKARDGSIRNVKTETTYNISKGAADGKYTAPLDNFPDLMFANGIKTVPDPLVPGQTGSLVMNVRNNGGKPAIDVVLRLSLGDPTQGGLVFAEVKIPKLNPAQTQAVSVPWKVLPGGAKIVAVLDPDNKIQESNENNNRAEVDLKLPGARGTDLAVTQYGLSMRPFPAAKGEKVVLTASVYNIGTTDVSKVLVAFFRGDPKKGGKALGSVTLTKIEKGKSADAKLHHIILKEGAFNLYVVVDPYDDIAESSEENNIANRNFSVNVRGLKLSIVTDKSQYPVKTDATITVSLQNQTTKDWNGRGEVWIVDAKDKPVEKVGDITAKDIPSAGLVGWPYQIPVNWTAPATGTKHYFLGIAVDFTQALQQIGQSSETLDTNSIRVAWYDSTKKEYRLLPYKFLRSKGFDARSKAQGSLLLFLKDAIQGGTKAQIYIFFDKVGGSSPTTPKLLDFPTTGWQIAYAEDAGRIYIKERKADGTWAPDIYIQDIGSGTNYVRAVALGDFNKDGVTDLIAASYSTGKIYFYPGDRSNPKRFDITKRKEIGNFGRSYFPYSMQVGDINKDGNLDIMFGRYYYAYWQLGNGDGTFQPLKSLRMASSYYRPYGNVLIDYDKDGNLDLIFSTYYRGGIYFLKGDGKGGFATAKLLYTTKFSNMHGLAVADFNKDGHYDLLVNNSNTGDAYQIMSNGKGGWNTPVVVPSLDTDNYTAWAMADWNYDGILDLFATTYSSRKILLFSGNGTTYTASTKLNTASYNFFGIAVGHPTAQEMITAGKAKVAPVKKWTFTWNTKTTPPGPYRARVQLFESAGVIAEAKADFAVDPEIKARAELSTDRLAYPANAPVSFMSRIFNDSSNATYETLKCKIVIEDAKQKQIDVLSFTVTNLMFGRFREQATGWNTKAHPPGKYTATFTVEYLGKDIAKATTNFEILTSAASGIGLLGTLNVTPGLAKVGDTIAISFTVTNIGNQPFTNHEIKVRIFSDTDRKEKDTLVEKLNLAVQKSQKFNKSFDTSKLAKGDYTLMLTTKLGTQEFALDAATLQLRKEVKRPPMTVKITSHQQDDKVTVPVIAVSGDVADGDAKVTINDTIATVTGASTQASTFAVARVNLSSCNIVLEAKATRGKDTANDKVSIAFANNPVVMKGTKALKSTLTTPAGIAAGANGSILITDNNKGTVLRLKLDNQQKVTKETEVVKGLSGPGAVFEDADGNIYIAETSNNVVVRVKGGKKDNWLQASDGIVQPAAFASDNKGGLFVASAGNGKIYHVDKAKAVTLYSDGLQQPIGLAYDAKTGVLYALDKADGQLYSIAKKGEKPKSVASTLPGEAGGLTLVGKWLILADTKDNAIYIADTGTGKVKIVAGLLKGVAALTAVGKDGLAMTTNGQGPVYGSIVKLACVAGEEPEPGDEAKDEAQEEPQAETTKDASQPEFLSEKIQTEKSQVNDHTNGDTLPKEEGQEELLAPKGCGCNANTTPTIPLGMLFLGLSLSLLWFRRRRPTR